jgi:molecular chaperone IbpA
MRNYITLSEELARLAESLLPPPIQNMGNVETYPPFNIKTNKLEDKWVIEMALAGINQKEVSIVLDKNVLTISYEPTKIEKDEMRILHHGIAKRRFSRSFLLGEYVQVNGADYKDGILQVFLETIIPDDKKPKRIEIGSNNLKSLSE